MTYAIKNKQTAEFFGGFDANQSVKWVGADKAWTGSKATASAQASLLICHGLSAQRKPVAL